MVTVGALGCTKIFGASDPGNGISDAGHLVSIVSAVRSGGIGDCRRTDIPFEFNVRMENTTSEDAAVVRVASGGVVAVAGLDSALGKVVYVEDSLPFTPVNGVLRAHDGDVTYTVTLPYPCPVLATPASAVDSAVVDFQLFMTTKTGQYATPQIPVLLRYH